MKKKEEQLKEKRTEEKEKEKKEIIEGVCTYITHKKEYIQQEWYKCKTCRLEGNTGTCKACFDDCHKGHDTYFFKMATGFFCDCFTVRCKFQQPNYLRDKNEKKEVQKMREAMETDKIELTEEQKSAISRIYDTIVPVNLRWGGKGYMKVSLESSHFLMKFERLTK